MISLRQIEYLVALSETKHFRKAAEKVGVSQPTLSTQLSTLEKQLGIQLVERSRSSVIITPLGEEVLSIGKRILHDAQTILDLAASQNGQLIGSIRLGLPPTVSPYLLPLILPELHREHPKLKLYIREEYPLDLPASLLNGTHDVILTPLPLNHADFQVHPIFREPLYVVLSDEHPLASKDKIEPSDLQGESVLALERGHQLHDQVNRLCEEYGAQLRFDYEATSLDTVHQMIAMGMGISFLPGLYVQSSLSNIQGTLVKQLSTSPPSRTLGLAWRSMSMRDDDFALLESFIRKTISQHFQGFTLV